MEIIKYSNIFIGELNNNKLITKIIIMPPYQYLLLISIYTLVYQMWHTVAENTSHFPFEKIFDRILRQSIILVFNLFQHKPEVAAIREVLHCLIGDSQWFNPHVKHLEQKRKKYFFSDLAADF